jgi:hypothetical protein
MKSLRWIEERAVRNRELLKTRMVIYFAACITLTFCGPLIARFLGMGTGGMRACFMVACCLAAIVFLWAALREMPRLKNPT